MSHKMPSAVLELKGAYKKDPGRRNTKEPVGESFPENPPDHLDEVEQRHWVEIVGMLAAGVLQKSDQLTVEMLAVLLTEFRAKRASMSSANMGRMSKCINMLGMSPADRTRIQVDKPQDDDDFE